MYYLFCYLFCYRLSVIGYQLSVFQAEITKVRNVNFPMLKLITDNQ